MPENCWGASLSLTEEDRQTDRDTLRETERGAERNSNLEGAIINSLQCFIGRRGIGDSEMLLLQALPGFDNREVI